MQNAPSRAIANRLSLGSAFGRWRAPALTALLLLALLLAANVAALRLAAQRPYTIDAGGYGDQLLLREFYAQEENAAGDTYRWTGQGSELVVRGAALSAALPLTLLVGGTPEGAPIPLPLTLTVNGRPWGPIAVDPTPRRYRLLVPADDGSGLSVGFESPLTTTAADPRPVGLRLDSVELRLGPGALLPPVGHLLAQALCLALVALMLVPLRLPRGWLPGMLAALALLLGAVEAGALPVMTLYAPRLVGIAAALALLTWAALPLARRSLPWVGEGDLRWLWAIALLAIALRMAAMLYPPFATHDIGLNLRRLDAVSRGTLVLVAGSAEFADAQTIYPPAPYVALLPSYLLLGDRTLTLMTGLALLDGSSALLVGLLALRLAGGGLAARVAALLYACSGLAFTALWWGFTAQVFGQWCTALIALGLLAAFERPKLRAWLTAALFFQIAMLSHAGVAVLAVVWVTLALAFFALRGRPGPAWWRGAVPFYVGSGVAAIVLLFANVLVLMLGETQRAGGAVQGELWRGATELFVQGMLRAYTPLGLPIVIGGVGLLLWRLWRRPAAWSVTAAWLATTLLFVLIDLAYGLIVRHFYFALPLACVAGAALLAELVRHARWLLAPVLALAALFCASGLLLWLLATAEYLKPSMTPLTH
jgi:hypothetical protein